MVATTAAVVVIAPGLGMAASLVAASVLALAPELASSAEPAAVPGPDSGLGAGLVEPAAVLAALVAVDAEQPVVAAVGEAAARTGEDS